VVLSVAPSVPWGDHVGANTKPYRVTCTRIHCGGQRWTESLTRLVQAINADDAMEYVEKEILNDGDDCYGLAAEQVG
jgi:hypothetical protein